MIHRRDKFRAQKAVAPGAGKPEDHGSIQDRELRTIEGERLSAKVRLVNNLGKECEEEVAAVFVFIGSDPQTQLVKGMNLTLDDGAISRPTSGWRHQFLDSYAVGDVRQPVPPARGGRG